jgi:predicted lactoylglutathione lyase
MKLGAFSVSLAVKDLRVSQEFYEKLGFTVFAGSLEMKYLIMKNEQTLIGLFEGMFEKNILTFNPGWDQEAAELATFDDIREIQEQLGASGLQFHKPIASSTTGPASGTLEDPDGNSILIDQHR